MQQTELTQIDVIATDKIVVVSNPRTDLGDTGFTTDELAKKQSLIAAILKRAPKGFVPKDFQKAGRVSA